MVGALARERRVDSASRRFCASSNSSGDTILVLSLAYLPVFSVLPYGVKPVVFALDLLHASPAIGNLARIDGVVNDVL